MCRRGRAFPWRRVRHSEVTVVPRRVVIEVEMILVMPNNKSTHKLNLVLQVQFQPVDDAC